MQRYLERPMHARIILFFFYCILISGVGLGGCKLPALVPPMPASGAMPTSWSSKAPAAAVSARLVNRFEKKSGFHGPQQYGTAIGLDGDTLAVGASQRLAEPGYQDGTVFVYRREGDQWVEGPALTASNQDEPTQSDIHFGSALALQGDTLMVGAPEADDPASGQDSGAVYIFQRQAGQWQEAGILMASDRAANAHFGGLIEMRDGVLLVSGGYNGQFVYVYEGQGQAWVETARLTGEALGERDGFGTSLAIGENRLAVGAIDYDPQQERFVSSAVYLYKPQGQNWVQEAKLNSDEQGWTGFGHSLEIEGDTLVAGSAGDDAGYGSGAVYIFEYGPGGWEQSARLVAGDGSFFSAFGSSVDLQGDILAVGSGGDSSHEFWAGSVTLFRRVGDAWLDLLKLYPNEEDFEGVFFGGSLKYSGDTLLVAAPDEFGNAVYVYQVSQGER